MFDILHPERGVCVRCEDEGHLVTVLFLNQTITLCPECLQNSQNLLNNFLDLANYEFMKINKKENKEWVR